MFFQIKNKILIIAWKQSVFNVTIFYPVFFPLTIFPIHNIEAVYVAPRLIAQQHRAYYQMAKSKQIMVCFHVMIVITN